MSVAYLREVPLDVRLEAVRQLSVLGEDPGPLLEVAMNPGDVSAVLDEIDVDGYCQRGHAWTEANTYINPTTGHRRCRACISAWNKQRTREYREKREARKVPCVYCGAPTTAPGYRSGVGSRKLARCRACFYAQTKGGWKSA